MCKRIVVIMMVMVLLAGTFSNLAYASFNFNGRQSAEYLLSNGRKVRIEYHNGQPHYHELAKKGNRWVDVGSENLNDNNEHHKGGGKPSKGTRDIVKGNKQRSGNDRKAKNKADSLKKAWSNAEANAKRASKSFILKRKLNIGRAAQSGYAVFVLGATIYVLWWLLKLASGWGILLPV